MGCAGAERSEQVSFKIETILERRARQGVESKIAMREYQDDHNAKLARMAKLKEQRLAQQSIDPPAPGKRGR